MNIRLLFLFFSTQKHLKFAAKIGKKFENEHLYEHIANDCY